MKAWLIFLLFAVGFLTACAIQKHPENKEVNTICTVLKKMEVSRGENPTDYLFLLTDGKREEFPLGVNPGTYLKFEVGERVAFDLSEKDINSRAGCPNDRIAGILGILGVLSMVGFIITGIIALENS